MTNNQIIILYVCIGFTLAIVAAIKDYYNGEDQSLGELLFKQLVMTIWPIVIILIIIYYFMYSSKKVVIKGRKKCK